MSRCREVALQIVSVLAVLAHCLSAQGQVDSGSTFDRQIRPVFHQHCLGCHNSMQRAGGLSLETRADAQQGGDSRLPLLTQELEVNELYARIMSDDRAYRMPKDAPPLSDRHRRQIRLWLEQGANWPQEMEDEPSGTADAEKSWLGTVGDFAFLADEWTSVIPGRLGFVISLLLIQLSILFMERLRRRPERPLSVSRTWYAVCLLLWALAITVSTYHTSLSAAQQRAESLDAQVTSLQKKAGTLSRRPDTETLFGDPPVPQRPIHSPALGHTYYRGNCERNPELFNNGNYRTAEMAVQLCEVDGTPVISRGNVDGRPLIIRLTIRRSPSTPDGLFSDAIMKSVFLSDVYFRANDPQGDALTVPLTVVRPGWEWTSDFPVESLSADERSVGLIYMYKGRINDDKTINAAVHYGIHFEVETSDGQVIETSDVWMGALFVSPAVEPPTNRSRVPFSEWFSHTPIPEIVGKNSTDPKLLGIPEHLGSKPEAADTP